MLTTSAGLDHGARGEALTRLLPLDHNHHSLMVASTRILLMNDV